MRPLAAIAAVAFLALGAHAGSAIVLSDGQVIRGTEVTRQGDSYLVKMDGGNTVTFPAALVKEVRFEDDAQPKNPYDGVYQTTPKNLAGPPVPSLPSQDPKDQLAVFGPPTRWSDNAVDTSWRPTNAYDTTKDVMAGSRSTWAQSAVDTTWAPTSAYDMNKDVMAGSKSTWSKSAVDTTWAPTDGFGFKDLSGGNQKNERYPMSFTAPAPVDVALAASTPSGPTPWGCGEAIFAGSKKLAVEPLKSPAYAALGLPLYVAHAQLEGTSRKAIFTTAGGACRLVGGDTDAIRGMNLTPDLTMAQDAASLNAALVAARGGVPRILDKLDYALAFITLSDTEVSGSPKAKLTLITTPEELRTITNAMQAGCALSKGKRRKEGRAAAAAFATPKITAGREGDVVTFLTWSSAGGTLYKNTVILGRDGAVSVKRAVVATHLGMHVDPADPTLYAYLGDKAPQPKP